MKLYEIAQYLEIEYSGEDVEIDKISTLKDADQNSISFFHSEKYLNDLKDTKAKAVILSQKYASFLPSDTIPLITDEPYLKFALLTSLFAPKISNESSPLIKDDTTSVDESVRYGKNVKIGSNSIIMAGVYLGDSVEIGDNVLIYPNVSIYHGVKIGNNCIIHSGAVIGSDGYGFAHTKDGRHIKIYQLGTVILEDDVEIGANTTIDRGAIGDTVIRRGTKIDNLVQIGHNCDIGQNSLIVSQTGLAGSTTLGRNVVMGGQSGTAGHLKIGDFATIAARGGVTKSLEGGKEYGGAPAIEMKLWRKLQVAIARLIKK